MILDEVLALPKSGVVVLTKNKQVLISYTNSMAAHLEGLYSQFNGQKGIELKVFSAGVDIETLKLHAEYYRDLYLKSGATLLQSHLRKTITYRVRAVPSADIRSVMVELVTARGDSKPVGKFKNTQDAKLFIETCYGADNPYRLPVYAWNPETRDFLMQKSLLTLK